LALKEKMERENKGRRGNYGVLERQEKTTFKQLVDLYEKEGDGKRYILQFVSTYLNHFGEKKLSQITRGDLFIFREALCWRCRRKRFTYVKRKQTSEKEKIGSYFSKKAERKKFKLFIDFR